MDKHICKNPACGKKFNYCSACVFKKIPYKAAGFCSPECSAAFKALKTEIPEVIEVPVIETEIEVKPKAKRRPRVIIEPSIQIEDNEAVFADANDGIHE